MFTEYSLYTALDIVDVFKTGGAIRAVRTLAPKVADKAAEKTFLKAAE